MLTRESWHCKGRRRADQQLRNFAGWASLTGYYTQFFPHIVRTCKAVNLALRKARNDRTTSQSALHLPRFPVLSLLVCESRRQRQMRRQRHLLPCDSALSCGRVSELKRHNGCVDVCMRPVHGLGGCGAG